MNPRIEQATRFRIIRQQAKILRVAQSRWVKADIAYGLLIGDTIVAWVTPWYANSGNRQLGYQWNIIGRDIHETAETLPQAKIDAERAYRNSTKG